MKYLDGGKDHACVCMLELGDVTFAYMLTLAGVFCSVARKRIQDGYSSPFRTLVECDQKLVHDIGCDRELVSGDPSSDGRQVDI